jgi:hypothetical protein
VEHLQISGQLDVVPPQTSENGLSSPEILFQSPEEEPQTPENLVRDPEAQHLPQKQTIWNIIKKCVEFFFYAVV